MNERLTLTLTMILTTSVAAWFIHPILAGAVAGFWAVNFYYALFIEPQRNPPEPEAILTEEQRMAAGFTTMLTRERDRELKWKTDLEQRVKQLEGRNGK